MSFVSLQFFVFLALVMFCYFIAPQRFRWCVLLVSGYAFYWFLGGFFALSIISFTIATVYASGRWASALRTKKAGLALRRVPLAICLTLNIGLLMILKFSHFVFPSLGILLIAGVSFYTFQASGYLIDVYTGKALPEKNPLKLALFLSFFPQLVQGPISRHGEIAADLFSGHGWDWDRARSGAQRILWGFFMKFIIANYAATIVNNVFGSYWNYGGTIILFTLFIYSIQIYADFAAGINIALGVAEIFGVRLPENFNQPFFANSLADFWRRWHMTLGRWFKDYLFYPLALSKALSKVGKLSRKVFGMRFGKMFQPCLATFCVFFAVGVWHGEGMHILVFGFLNGLIISSSLFMEPFFDKLRARTGIDGSKSGFGRVFAALRTLAILMLLRYFIRSASLDDAVMLFRRTVYHPRIRELWNGTMLELGLGISDYIVLTLGVCVLFARDFITETGRKCDQLLNDAKPVMQFAFLLSAILSIVIFGIYSGDAISADFIYAQY